MAKAGVNRQRRGDGFACDERKLGPDRHVESWAELDREEKPAARSVFPDTSQPAASFGLVVGGDGRSLRLVVSEEPLRRRALGDEAVRPAEASCEEWLDRLWVQVRRHGVVD
jgi:hypothetical protein